MEFLELTFSRHDSCNLLCDTSLALARSSPTRRYTGYIRLVHGRKVIIHWPHAKFLPLINPRPDRGGVGATPPEVFRR